MILLRKILVSYRGVILKTKSLLVTLLALTSTLQGNDRGSSLHLEISRLTELLSDLSNVSSYAEKIALLDELSEVQSYLAEASPLRTFLAGLSQDCEYAIKATFAINQGASLFDVPTNIVNPVPYFRRLLDDLLAIDDFYQDIGGIVGYQCLVLSLLAKTEDEVEEVSFKPPPGLDLSKEDTPEVRHAILEGIRHQKEMAEFYPVGGAADRLQLKDGQTGKGLPAACLIFQGKQLLEGMVHDLQAREYLYYKLFDEQILTPLALMTSKVNRNHDHIQEICVKNQWFGRPRESFKFFTQPSVPVFTEQGNWCLRKPLKLQLRPGGHGVIWKLAQEKGIFDWLHSQGKKKALVRQINNPMAAVDYGLAAFLGVGHKNDKAFGFASCERRVNAHEGMIVLKEKVTPEGSVTAVTNVEYCDFEKNGLQDKPKDETSPFSLFPSNTNILFVDLEAVQEAIQTLPFPGLLVNFRMGSHYLPTEGTKKEKIARLETTMQNIADAFVIPTEDSSSETLPAYVTFNERRKTISTTKRKTAADGQLLETPEGCFYDFMQNAQELLSQDCGMKLLEVNDESAFLCKGPSFLMSYHPALGPFYSIIRQKIQGGEIRNGSELQLEIADLELKNLFLDGSLLIFADNLMGHKDTQGQLAYSNRTGQCCLKNVRIQNEGIDWNAEDHLFWKHEIKRRASLTIHLVGHSRFEAENVTFTGDHTVEVPDGVYLIVTEQNGKLHYEERPLREDQSFWTYQVEPDESITLHRD